MSANLYDAMIAEPVAPAWVVNPQAGPAIEFVGMANSLGRAPVPYGTLNGRGHRKGAFLPVPDIPIGRQVHDRE